MNRTQLAGIVSDAYFSQYINDNGVANDPIIVYDKNTKLFSWQSSLTPLQDDDTLVDTLTDGMFGDPEADGVSQGDLARWLAEENDDYWDAITEAI